MTGIKKENALLNAYLFNGDDDLKRETLANRLIARIAADDQLGMNVQIFSAEKLGSREELIAVLTTLPLGAPLRLVLIKNGELLSKELSEALIDYLKSPNLATVLALSTRKLASNTRLFKAFLSYNRQSVIDASSVKRNDLPQLVRQMAIKYHQQLSYDAARTLIDKIGTSTVALDKTVETLSSWAAVAGKSELTVADIREFVVSVNEPKIWELTDALTRRDAALCLQMVKEMRSQTPLGIFLACLNRLREILSVQALWMRGLKSNEQIAAELGKKAWMLREVLAARELFSTKELIEILKQAPKAEARFKSGADAQHELILWLLKVCRG